MKLKGRLVYWFFVCVSPFVVCLSSRGCFVRLCSVLFGILPCWFFGFAVLWCSLGMRKGLFGSVIWIATLEMRKSFCFEQWWMFKLLLKMWWWWLNDSWYDLIDSGCFFYWFFYEDWWSCCWGWTIDEGRRWWKWKN